MKSRLTTAVASGGPSGGPRRTALEPGLVLPFGPAMFMFTQASEVCLLLDVDTAWQAWQGGRGVGMNEVSMVKLKVCGITSIDDGREVMGHGAHYIGMIFYSKSPRCVDIETARSIVSNVHGDYKSVGVFVNEKIERVREVASYVGLDIVQLHGDETPEYCEQLGLPYWKAIRVENEKSLKQLKRYKPEAFLLDTFVEGAYGGTGRTFDASLAERAIGTGKRIIIAGGVSVGNVAQLAALKPYGLDVSSSLEFEPGIKNYAKLAHFFAEYKSTQKGNKPKE